MKREKPEIVEGFENASILFRVSLEKFLAESFFQSASAPPDSKTGFLTFSSNDPKGTYHVLLSWFLDPDQIDLRIEYVCGSKEKSKDEKPPYAEDVMNWLGEFFKHENAQAHCHAFFRFPLDGRRSLFPLPLKTSLQGDAEIDGISLNLPSKPNGTSKIRISMGRELWYIEAVADSRIVFGTFNLRSYLLRILSSVDSVMEKRTI